MDKQSKKAKIQEYRNRKPEMGVVSLKHRASGRSFLGISKDTKADINSNVFQLRGNTHPNKELQALWQESGKEGFEIQVLKVLKYEDPQKDHTKELEKLRDQLLLEDEKAQKIRR